MSFLVMQKIQEELRKQNEKWGEDRNLPNMLWYAILGEEYGEVGRAILEAYSKSTTHYVKSENLYEELAQCAAVIIHWMENIDRLSYGGMTEEEIRKIKYPGDRNVDGTYYWDEEK